MTKEALTLALEALKSSNKLINGTGTKFGLAGAMDGYYSGCFDVEGNNKLLTDAITAIKEALAQTEQVDDAAPVAKNEGGRITWMIEDWPQNCLLYTHPPVPTAQPKEPEQEPDTLNYTVHVECKRCGSHERYDLEIDAPTTQRKPLTDDEWFEFWQVSTALDDCEIQEFPHFLRLVRAIQAHKIKE